MVYGYPLLNVFPSQVPPDDKICDLEVDLLPQKYLDILINKITARCAACVIVRFDQTLYTPHHSRDILQHVFTIFVITYILTNNPPVFPIDMLR